MTPAEIKTFFAKQIASSRDDYVRDLEAMSEEQLAHSPGGEARSGYDFTYEVALINRRLAKRIRGETPEPMKFEGFLRAPEELRTKAAAVESIQSSMAEVLAAWNGLPEDELGRKIELPSGEITNPFDLAFTCAMHTSYHDAQLNYLQSMAGDKEVHWEGQ